MNAAGFAGRYFFLRVWAGDYFTLKPFSFTIDIVHILGNSSFVRGVYIGIHISSRQP
ncbi:hypothetical protein J41TS2_43910 [Bacillus sonorensis]|nr:hypothetical protein J41TS2_43910 [Bacillus sonorensis]